MGAIWEAASSQRLRPYSPEECVEKVSGKSELAPNRGSKSRQVETNEPGSGHLVPPGHTVGCPLG